MSNNDKQFYTIALLIFAIILGITFIFLDGSGDPTCPDYGTVPISINGGDIICVPWEKVQDFDQFED